MSRLWGSRKYCANVSKTHLQFFTRPLYNFIKDKGGLKVSTDLMEICPLYFAVLPGNLAAKNTDTEKGLPKTKEVYVLTMVRILFCIANVVVA